jgi:hypothetical protein
MDDQENKKPNLQITELFGAKAGNDWYRFFYGIIKRNVDQNGNPHLYSKITMDNGFVCSCSESQQKLSRKLDELVLLVLDYELHANISKTSKIANEQFYHS